MAGVRQRRPRRRRALAGFAPQASPRRAKAPTGDGAAALQAQRARWTVDRRNPICPCLWGRTFSTGMGLLPQVLAAHRRKRFGLVMSFGAAQAVPCTCATGVSV